MRGEVSEGEERSGQRIEGMGRSQIRDRQTPGRHA